MKNILKILLFLVINAASFYIIPLLINLAVWAGILVEFTSQAMQDKFLLWTSMGYFAWLMAAIFSLGFFFSESRMRLWFLLSPLYVTTMYMLVVLFYFGAGLAG